MTTVTTLTEADRPRWAELWRAYLDFYHTEVPPEQYDYTWARLFDGRMHGLAARDDQGRMIGLTHYLMHEHGWTMQPACYLQDLYVDTSLRGTGAGRALIEAVASDARAGGASRLYWLTNAQNATARQLYDRLASHGGFIKYDYPL